MRFIARDDDGTETDVTDDVACLYDLVINSMDWGSGFLTVEDAMQVVRVAKLGGFNEWERAQAYVDAQAHSLEQAEFLRNRPDADARPVSREQQVKAMFTGTGLLSGVLGKRPPYVDHEHVWSSAGKCMWRSCDAVREDDSA